MKNKIKTKIISTTASFIIFNLHYFIVSVFLFVYYLILFLVVLKDCLEAEWLEYISETGIEFTHEFHPERKKKLYKKLSYEMIELHHSL